MVDKKQIIVVFGLLFSVILPVLVLGECVIPDEASGQTMKSGFIFGNMFLCPYNPTTIETPETPICPRNLDFSKFSGSTGKFYIGELVQEGDYYNQARPPAEGDNEITIEFQPDDACYEGIEGQYYVWFQTHSASLQSTNPADGYCYNIAHSVNWDTIPAKYCTEGCVGKKVDWIQGSSLTCCGDDAIDCSSKGQIGNDKYLCGSEIKAEGEEWEWMKASDYSGQIKQLACGDVEVLSDGSNFVACSNNDTLGADWGDLNFAYITTGTKTHAYTCFEDVDERKKIAECVGAGSSTSTYGVKKAGGESILVNNETYYCVTNRSREDELTLWSKDLDSIGYENRADCITAKKPDGTSARFTWTGTKCCSEADDENEYYNDGEGYSESYTTPGGCWNGNFVLSGTKPLGASNNVINYKGIFEGCQISGEEDLEILDTHTQQPLIHNNEQCTVFPNALSQGTHLFCSFNNVWEQTDRADQPFLKGSPWSGQKGCCAETECWNSDSDTCIPDQSDDAWPITYHDFRCINGEWNNETVLRFTANGRESGYCPNSEECLLNPSPNAVTNCVASGTYELNTYCEGGEWASRTNLLALSLLQYASSKSPNEYTLFCDNYKNILNYYDYEVGGEAVLNYLKSDFCQGKPCVNEFCVLKIPGNVAFGVSLNEPVDSQKSFLKALGKSENICDSQKINDKQYHSCGGGIWYNHNHGTIISLPESDTLGAVSWSAAFAAFIKNPFDTIKNWIVPRNEELEFFNQTKMFTKLYSNVYGEKRVFAFLEEGQTVYVDGWPLDDVDYLGLEYQNLDITPCGLIRNYDSSISCTSDQNIFAQKKVGSQNNLVDAWPDLTAKLRLR